VKGSALVDLTQASPNHEARVGGVSPQLLVLHYTGMASGRLAVDWLCNAESRVSCHYLVDDDGTIVQMVDEDRRAWHAGTSSWHGETDINSFSIGIEIQNLGHGGGCPAFPKVQMQRVAALSLDIMQRHGLTPAQVLAHSDVAPGRKIDPGENFDWEFLAEQGVGQMVVAQKRAVASETVMVLQRNLKAVGYGIELTGEFDDRTQIVVEALQRRYRRFLVNGAADAETADILRRLLAVQTRR
jgi:N-acetylmuramoyl-L-alanine amidase